MKQVVVVALAAGLTACATAGPHKLEIRSVGKPAAASVAMPLESRLAEGSAELALGNVGLALERFRVAARDNPTDPRPLQGLAASYERMGRIDLSRRYLEQALALAPRSRTLMAAEQRAQTIEARQEMVAAPPRADAAAADRAPGPRLVRMSLGEVALVTGASSPFAQRPERLVAIRVEPRAKPARAVAETRRVDPAALPIRLLNAARADRLASRTRERLGTYGWRRLTVGDAPGTLAHTVIRYPAQQRTKAVMLALAFRKARLEPTNDGAITVLLGRDTARLGLARE
ncbi:LytR C-terminal domain-containing protein [Sphingomonas sp. ASV193]|uniref:LytR C-terminal domain-containing protein n=1 Tax=Sphingomonas sp. ASV193 TaxID=3144405 RepID=UPI0032E8E46D